MVVNGQAEHGVGAGSYRRKFLIMVASLLRQVLEEAVMAEFRKWFPHLERSSNSLGSWFFKKPLQVISESSAYSLLFRHFHNSQNI